MSQESSIVVTSVIQQVERLIHSLLHNTWPFLENMTKLLLTSGWKTRLLELWVICHSCILMLLVLTQFFVFSLKVSDWVCHISVSWQSYHYLQPRVPTLMQAGVGCGKQQTESCNPHKFKRDFMLARFQDLLYNSSFAIQSLYNVICHLLFITSRWQNLVLPMQTGAAWGTP